MRKSVHLTDEGLQTLIGEILTNLGVASTKRKRLSESIAHGVKDIIKSSIKEGRFDNGQLQKYEDAFIGATIIYETDEFPYFQVLKDIVDVWIETFNPEFKDAIAVSNSNGKGLGIKRAMADELISKGYVDDDNRIMVLVRPTDSYEWGLELINQILLSKGKRAIIKG